MLQRRDLAGSLVRFQLSRLQSEGQPDGAVRLTTASLSRLGWPISSCRIELVFLGAMLLRRRLATTHRGRNFVVRPVKVAFADGLPLLARTV